MTEPMSGISTGPPGASPEKMYCDPLGCELPMPGIGCVMQRTTASLSSVSPRSLRQQFADEDGLLARWWPDVVPERAAHAQPAASGLGSHVSICDTPPCSNRTRTLVARPALVVLAVAKRPPASDSRPHAPRPMKLRRFSRDTCSIIEDSRFRTSGAVRGRFRTTAALRFRGAGRKNRRRLRGGCRPIVGRLMLVDCNTRDEACRGWTGRKSAPKGPRSRARSVRKWLHCRHLQIALNGDGSSLRAVSLQTS